MRSFSAKSSSSVIRLVLLAATISLLIAPAISAQTSGASPSGTARPSPTGGSVPEMARQPSIRERQMKITEMERAAAKVRTPEQEKLALAQISEDYEKIQVVNNKMMAATMPAASPDYGRVAEVTAEIKLRANRMKENLRLLKPDPRDSEKSPSYKKSQDAATLKANLLALDGSIMSFVKSPIFMNPAVVDVEQAAKASRELETVIEFSSLINKDAQKLKKLAEKTP
ncbi:MAG TPA: hypothetical protein VGO56_03640 [Pyrinomonadaceae bacterium]|jgi:hypothetical protein|nr:hypothetical protein [Pyrinomonadaceae bacterium]